MGDRPFALPVEKGQRIAFVSGVRTPFARQGTAFRHVPAVVLGQFVVAELLRRCPIPVTDVDMLVFGQVIQMPEAPNIAREIVLGTSLPVSTDAYSVTRACATSFQSVVSVAEAMMSGTVDIAIAGGADSSSVLPITVSKRLANALLRWSKAKTPAQKWAVIRGLRFKDLLPVAPAIAEYSTGLSMGDTAEQMAKSYHISRADQDLFAHRSHQRAAAAWEQGLLADEVMVAHLPPYEEYLEQDNVVRHDSALDSYQRLSPVFDKQYGTVTAANSSPLTDGAAALLMMRESTAKALGLQPLGFLRSYAFTAIDVWQDMLMGPAYTTPIALDRAGVSLADLALIDMHEAFSAQCLTNLKMFSSTSFAQQKLGRKKSVGEVDMDKFNVLGGSIAYGHPFAATGARMILQTLNELKRRGGGLALNTACAAGGLGSAMVLEVDE